MKLTVVESFCRAATGSPTGGDDRVAVTADFVAVIDGTTSKTRDRRPNLFSGSSIAESISEKIASLEPNCKPAEAVIGLCEAIKSERDWHRAHDAIPMDETPAASVVILSIGRREIWRIGDCSVGLDGKFSLIRAPHEEIAAATRATYLQFLVYAGANIESLRQDDPGRQLVLPLLRAAATCRNRPGKLGFGTIDGITDPLPFLEVIPIPDDCRMIVLTSDGYPEPAMTLALSEENLRTRISRDPLMIGPPPTTKGVIPGNESFDDRSYVRVEVSR